MGDSYSWGRVTVVIVFIFNKKAKDGYAWAKPLSQGQRDADRREGRGGTGSANVQQLLTHCAGIHPGFVPRAGGVVASVALQESSRRAEKWHRKGRSG